MSGEVAKLENPSPLRAFKGPLTSELELRQGPFGLGQLPVRSIPDATTTTTCGFCSTGCGLSVHLKGGTAVNLTPAQKHPVNLGMACPKGWEALAPLDAPDRGVIPLLRDPRKGMVPVAWDVALHTFCQRMKEVQGRHGPDSVAWLGTGQIVTEELALLGALAKFGMGMVHGDGNTRQCMATAVSAYKESFGFDAPPYTYADFEQSDVIVLIGSNLCVAHPILWQRIMLNRRTPEIIVIDPRKTETAMMATTHVALAPKSDLMLFYGLAHLLVKHGWVDTGYIEKHTSGYEEFTRHLAQFTLELTARATGLPEDTILRLARMIHPGRRVSFWWTMGVNQGHEATRTAQAIINLALMTGNIGRPGTGANSITGQCNAMGSRLYSNTTNLFGGREFTNPADRAEVGYLLHIDPALIPDQSSWAYDQIIDGIDSGRIKALWIIATNTAHSWINKKRVSRLFGKLEFLVVQDMYTTPETVRHAHLYLPAAGWGEKVGTFINSERRIGLVKKVAKAPGEALSDFSIFKLVALYWGCKELFREWSTPEAVFQILKRLSRGRPCDISGIHDYSMLDTEGGIQWPFRETGSAALPERRLFEDGKFFHPDEKAVFIFDTPKPPPEVPNEAYPFILLTGRGSSAQWHTLTRTDKSAILRQLSPQRIYVEINSADARALGIMAGEQIRISSARSSISAAAVVTDIVLPGQIFMPMHFAEVNRLTADTFDPQSRQPSYKHCAVRVEKIPR